MKTIGVLFGMENSFPGALVEHINGRNIEGVRAEFVQTGAVELDKAPHYAVIVDRISHDIPFYRAFLKHAAINGTVVINNPFWWSADDKFFNYTLARRLGVAVPPTVILPHKHFPEGTTEKSMRNLEYPLNWDAVFAYVGEHGFLKPVDGGGWRDVYHIHNREEFFRAYDQSRDLCMMYQKAVDFKEYFRCYVVAQRKPIGDQRNVERGPADVGAKYVSQCHPLRERLPAHDAADRAGHERAGQFPGLD